MRFVLVLLVTTVVVAVGSYRVIAKVFTNSRPRVLQAEVSEKTTVTSTLSEPEGSLSRRPKPTSTVTPTITPTLSEPEAALSRRPNSLVLPAPPATPEQIHALIERFAAQYAVGSDVLRYIAVCESGFNPLAVNVPYVGLYQFSSSAWIKNRELMGEDANPALRYDAEESVQTAAYIISAGKIYLWPNCQP